MADFPGSLYTKTVVTDDVTDVLAAHHNDQDDELLAVETELGTDPAGSCTDVKTRLAHSINNAGFLEFDDCTELTIATGVITVTQNYHKIDTEGDTSTDNLDTINGYSTGLWIILRTVADARDVVVKHNTGNILCASGADIDLTATNQFVFGIYDNGQSKWLLSRGAGASDISGSGVANEFAYFTDASTITSNDILSYSSGKLVINEQGDDHDTRIEGASDAALFVIDAGNDRVGIGTATPGTKLDVDGDVTIRDGHNLVIATTTGSKIGTATNQKLGFFNATPVVQQTELTDELTTITHTAPGTPDYAIQDLTTTTPYGFVTKDEGNSVLAVIANLQARVNELETKLVALGLLADAD